MSLKRVLTEGTKGILPTQPYFLDYKIQIGSSITLTAARAISRIEVTYDYKSKSAQSHVNLFNINENTYKALKGAKGQTISIYLGYREPTGSTITPLPSVIRKGLRLVFSGVIRTLERSRVNDNPDQSLNIYSEEPFEKALTDLVVNQSYVDKTPTEIVKDVLKQASISTVGVKSPIGENKISATYTGKTGIQVVSDLARRYSFYFQTIGGRIVFQSEVVPGTPSAWDASNIILLKNIVENVLNDETSDQNIIVKNFRVIGDSDLKPFNTIAVNYLETRGLFHISNVTHDFDSQHGYTCNGKLVEFKASATNTDQLHNEDGVNLANNIEEFVELTAQKNQPVDVGELETVDANKFTTSHTLDVRLGQNVYNAQNRSVKSWSRSLSIPTNSDEYAIAKDVPLLSQYIGDGYGLFIPTEKSMRSVLLQHKAINDRILLGFLQTEEMDKNVPTHYDSDYYLLTKAKTKDLIPTYETQGVSVDDVGSRTINTKSLKFEVGTEAVADATRPTPPLPETIEFLHHYSGKKNHITLKADGSLEILFNEGGSGDMPIINVDQSGSNVIITIDRKGDATETIVMDSSQISVNHPTKVSVTAPNIEMTGSTLTKVIGDFQATGDVKGATGTFG